MFLLVRSYTFVSFTFHSLFLSLLFILLIHAFCPFFFFILIANRRDKLASVLLTHSSTINLLFTGQNKSSFLLRRTWNSSMDLIDHIELPSVHPSCSQLFSTCLQTCVLLQHHVLLSTCNQPPDPCLTNFSDVRTSREPELGSEKNPILDG